MEEYIVFNYRIRAKNAFKIDSEGYHLHMTADEILYLCNRIMRCNCVVEGVKNGNIPIKDALLCAIAQRNAHGIDEICYYPDANYIYHQPERSKREDSQQCEMRCSEHCGNTVRRK